MVLTRQETIKQVSEYLFTVYFLFSRNTNLIK